MKITTRVDYLRLLHDRVSSFRWICTLVVLMSASQASATTPFFWDDFERDEFLESEINWQILDNTEIEMKDGSISITPLVATFPGISAQTPEPITDLSMRAAIRFHEHDNCCAINPWRGVAQISRTIGLDLVLMGRCGSATPSTGK